MDTDLLLKLTVIHSGRKPRTTTMVKNYFSKFGGMWIDQIDFLEKLLSESNKGEISHEEFNHVLNFSVNGYTAFNELINHKDCDALRSFYLNSFSEGNSDLIVQKPGETGGNRKLTQSEPMADQRIVDLYMANESSLKILLNHKIRRFLKICFDDSPLLFQSLSFLKGSNQGIHQDTAYVVTDKPMQLIASWIALEDIQTGSGELEFYPQSHRFEEFFFSSEFKHYCSERDGGIEHEKFSQHLKCQIAKSKKTSQKFMAKKGDVFLWHADLYHGGRPVADSNLTRNSIVGHYCPITARPNYFNDSNDEVYEYEDESCYYSSCYY